MAKPMLLTMVNAVPFCVSGAFWATKVANIGESAMTTIDQNPKKIKKKISDELLIKNGETKQHTQEAANVLIASFLTLNFRDKIPINIQETVPQAIILNETIEIFKLFSG